MISWSTAAKIGVVNLGDFVGFKLEKVQIAPQHGLEQSPGY